MDKKLINYIDSIIGIPYVTNGRGATLDCFGLVLKFYKEFLDIEIVDDSIVMPDGWYNDPKNGQYMNKMVQQHGVLLKEPDLYSIVLMAPEGHFLSNHIGIFVGEGKVVHTTITTGVCQTPLTALKNVKKIRGYVRLER